MLGLGTARPWIVVSCLVAGGCDVEFVRLSHPPSAFAGYDTDVLVGQEVALDGSFSFDPDGDPLELTWRIAHAPSGATAKLDAPNAKLVRFAPDVEGTWVIGLSVSDGDFVDRDLVAVRAHAALALGPRLALSIAPSTCHADLSDLAASRCGASDSRLAVTASVADTTRERNLHVEWIFARLPAGTSAAQLEVETPSGPLGELTFAPTRPGEYWISARLVSNARASPPDFATIAIFDDAPGAAARPRAHIAGPSRAALRDRVLLDGRGSFVPTSTGARATYTWTLLLDPSEGGDLYSDTATGCPMDRCRLLLPSQRGTYVAALSIEQDGQNGVTALHTIEVD